MPAELDYSAKFQMPQPVRITGRSSSITNSFINAIIPVIPPKPEEVRAALEILGMLDAVCCAYCGDGHTEWDHLRPLVRDKQPTGYISEIHNLVPACGKCNQSKGNKDWHAWIFSTARLSPATRGKQDLEVRAERLRAYEAWMPPTIVDFETLVGTEAWTRHWRNYEQIIALMHDAQRTATAIRETVRAAYLAAPDARPTLG